jgi:hypothetical protein
VGARHNLAAFAHKDGNMDKATKHSIIAAGFGHAKSLVNIRFAFRNGFATRDDYEKALRAYHEHIEAVKSDQRDEAAAFHDRYKYLIEVDS